MRRLALTIAVLGGLAAGMPAHATTGTDRADIVGITQCTVALVVSVGNRPFPTTPLGTVTYTVATAQDGVGYVFCVAI